MGNRIIKESIKYSPEIDRLTWFQEVVFYRMLVSADDYGRLDGRIVVLAHDLFPTKEGIAGEVENAIDALVDVGLVIAYEVDGRPYVCLPTWSQHQRVRNSVEKHPAPPPDAAVRRNSRQVAARCGEPPQAAAEIGSRARNPIQSESNPNPTHTRIQRAQARAREDNPFGDGGDERPDFNTVEAYIANNIPGMNAANLEEMASFKADLPDDVIRYAVDIACGKNVRTWHYVRGILNRILAGPARTLAEVKDWDAKHAPAQGTTRVQPVQNPALNYEQRDNSNVDPDEYNLDLEHFLATGEKRSMADRARELAKGGAT